MVAAAFLPDHDLEHLGDLSKNKQTNKITHTYIYTDFKTCRKTSNYKDINNSQILTCREDVNSNEQSVFGLIQLQVIHSF